MRPRARTGWCWSATPCGPPGCPRAPTPSAAGRNAAQAIGVDDVKGTLEPGKDADLVLLDPALRVVVTVAEGAVVHGGDHLQRHPAPAGRAPPE
jgi:cytosine/adenosine deaminase-related metal-dependent hydrolase